MPLSRSVSPARLALPEGDAPAVNMGQSQRDSQTLGSVSACFTAEENAAFEYIHADLANFEDYERQFQEVLINLENDEAVDAFKVEYAGLHYSFLKGHEGESRLLHKCLDLQADIVSCIAKAQVAEGLTQGDRQTIESLHVEIDRTRKKFAQVTEKEGVLREKIGRLKKEVTELELKSSEPIEVAVQEAALQSLLRVQETMHKEKETQEVQNTSIRNELANVQWRVEQLEEVKAAQGVELRVLRDAIDAKQQESDAILATKQSKEEELRGVREHLTRRNTLLLEKQARIDQLHDVHTSHQEAMRKVLEEQEQLAESYQGLCRQLQNANGALQECNVDNDALQKNMREMTAELQSLQEKATAVHKEYVKELKLLEALQRRNAVAELKRAEIEQGRCDLKEQVRLKEEELQRIKSVCGAIQKELGAIHREKDLLHQVHLTAAQQTERNKLLLAEKASQLYHAEHELSAFQSFVQRQNEEVYRISKECTTYEEQTKKYAFQVATLMGDVHARDMQMTEVQRQIEEVEQKLVHQQTLLETTVQERNQYALHYQTLRHNLGEANKRLKLLIGQSEHAKDEVVRRQRALIAEEKKIESTHRQQRDLTTRIQALQQGTERQQQSTTQFNLETRKLRGVLECAQEEVGRQQRRCRDIQNERDALSNQAQRRQNELKELYARCCTQQGMLRRAEAQYRERVQHLDQLHYESTRLAEQLRGMRAFVARLPELRLLLNNATRELRQEQAKVRSLLDVAERPLNLHPDHQLAWSEPETFALTERVHKLQRELVERRQLLESTEHLIEKTEGEYLRAKAVVARQPGPEVAEQISAYQSALVKKKGHLKQLQDTLQYFRQQTEFYRSRHDELRSRLSAMTEAYVVAREECEADGAGGGGGEGAPADGTHAALDPTEHAGDAEPLVYTGFVAPPLEPPLNVSHQLQPW